MYSALGYWLIEQKRIGCAVPAFRSGVKLAPGSFEARLNPGDDNARGALGEVEKEIAQGAARHFQRSSQLIQAGRRAEAIAELQSAIRMKPDYAEALRLAPDLAAAHLIQGRALYDLKHYEEARAALGQALRLAPGDPQALYRLGLAEARLNHPARTAELTSKVLAAEPGNATAHLELGQALQELGAAPRDWDICEGR